MAVCTFQHSGQFKKTGGRLVVSRNCGVFGQPVLNHKKSLRIDNRFDVSQIHPDSGFILPVNGATVFADDGSAGPAVPFLLVIDNLDVHFFVIYVKQLVGAGIDRIFENSRDGGFGKTFISTFAAKAHFHEYFLQLADGDVFFGGIKSENFLHRPDFFFYGNQGFLSVNLAIFKAKRRSPRCPPPVFDAVIIIVFNSQ